MPTSRERFLQTLEFRPPALPWVRCCAFLWDETDRLWRTQGYDGQPLDDVFGLDRLARVDPWYGPMPAFERHVVAEDERTVLYVNHEGILLRELKEHRDTSMPQFVTFPVANAEDYEVLAQRLGLNAEHRFTGTWKWQVAGEGRVGLRSGVDNLDAAAAAQARQTATDGLEEVWPRLCWADRWGGFFGPLRNMMGLENLCYAFHDQPKLIQRMMSERADAIIAITNEVLRYCDFDMFWFWEDMAFKGGSLINPRVFREFAFPHYRRVCDWLHQRGIQHIGLDSDGNISELIPIWLEAGINILWPFEVQAGMDVVKVRQTYGHDLVMMGGIDKRKLAEGGAVMRREVDRVMPLVEDGGYVPELDHSVPPDISWPAFCDYIAYLKCRLGRG